MAPQQPTYLRVDGVSDADMQMLTEANERIVDYYGRPALLRLNGWTPLDDPKHNYVTLDFEWPDGERAEGDFTDVLNRLDFREA